MAKITTRNLMAENKKIYARQFSSKETPTLGNTTAETILFKLDITNSPIWYKTFFVKLVL